jgi:phytanoyl-CoA hydroxylase
MSLHSKKEQIHTLREQGFVVVPGLVSPERCEQLKQIAQQQLLEAAGPIEFEADLQYPGAPSSKDAPGGHTAAGWNSISARSRACRACITTA